MLTTPTNTTDFPLTVTWEKLPDGYVLPDDPVDNIYQPAIAAALTEILAINQRLPELAMTTTDYGICATVNGKTIVKAPDWSYIPERRVDRREVDMSYTPYLQGDCPAIVIEFISPTDGGEYSTQITTPMGKWLFYEQIVRVPYYAIFEPISGDLEVYQLDAQSRYQRLNVTETGRYWIDTMQLSLGAFYGSREGRTGYWLRWWDQANNLLPWREELLSQERDRTALERDRAEQEKQRAEQEKQRAEQEKQRADRLAAYLREQGIDPDMIS
jgi:Uma2 family endonuclease